MTNPNKRNTDYQLEREILEARERGQTNPDDDPPSFTLTRVGWLDSILSGLGRWSGILLLGAFGGIIWVIVGLPRFPGWWLLSFVPSALFWIGVTRTLGRSTLRPFLYWLFPYQSWFTKTNSE